MGYRKTTIKLVAERADVSPVTIYNHFEDKTGLLFAVLAEEGQETLRIGERLISDRQPRDATVIYQLLELYVDHPCLLYTSPSPRDRTRSRMPSSA